MDRKKKLFSIIKQRLISFDLINGDEINEKIG